MAGMKPFSQACVNNRDPILSILKRALTPCTQVLEIGSGTGQHAVHFAPALDHLYWQPSDRQENIPAIYAWMAEQPSSNLLPPVVLDVDKRWPAATYDGFFTANTCHIMAWESVVNLFAGLGRVARPGSVLAVYGPFKYGGEFTSQSNARFDQWLKSQHPHQGIRDIEDINRLAENAGFGLVEDNAMPANNQLLVFHCGS